MGNFKPGWKPRDPRPRKKRARAIDSVPKLAARRTPKTTDTVIVEFYIVGNHRDSRNGNPYPKSRLTKRQQWTDEAKDYVAWKNYVANAFLKACPEQMRAVCEARFALGGKPIPPFVGKARMEVLAYYKNGRHPDTENVFGSIADSLFEDDNALVGEFDFIVAHPKHSGSTHIVIKLPDIF